MTDTLLARLNEVTIVLYAFTVLFYFIDFLQHNRKAGKAAFWLLSIVWILQTVYIFYLHAGYTDQFPVLNNAQGLYFYAWVLVTLSLVLTKLLKVDFLVFFTNLIGFSMAAIHTFTPTAQQSAELSGRLRVRAFDHPHYDGDSFIRGIFIVLCLFRAVSFSVPLIEKEKVGEMAFENRRFVKT